MDNNEKVRENKLRRMAQRQDLVLTKSRRRDPRAWDYGMYLLSDCSTDGLVISGWASLDDVEVYLTTGEVQATSQPRPEFIRQRKIRSLRVPFARREQ